ncbi:MAG: EVE domain-containing protein [Chloroflexi bacterium]|nr:EVE domain-containing protein [Chloroflexota bacterium]MCZ6891267.1 EVE domain-containing protein [Chloroflexota bacterium]
MARNYWMVVISTENFHIIKERDFSVYGFRAKLKKRVERMEVGDRMLFYLSKEQRFPATVTVTSTMFEDREPLLKAPSGQEDFPYRVHIEPTVVLEEEDYIDARQLGPTLEYVKKWIPERWPLAFIGDLHLIPKKDLFLIEDEMKRITSKQSPSKGGGRGPAPEPALQSGEE